MRKPLRPKTTTLERAPCRHLLLKT
jgi:hypothetical protein